MPEAYFFFHYRAFKILKIHYTHPRISATSNTRPKSFFLTANRFWFFIHPTLPQPVHQHNWARIHSLDQPLEQPTPVATSQTHESSLYSFISGKRAVRIVSRDTGLTSRCNCVLFHEGWNGKNRSGNIPSSWLLKIKNLDFLFFFSL